MNMKRREFITSSLSLGGALAALALPWRPSRADDVVSALAQQAVANGEREVVFAGGSGAYLQAVKENFYRPFTAATGIRVIPVSVPYGQKAAKLRAMYEAGNLEWDMVSFPVDDLVASTEKYLRNLGNCSSMPNVLRYGIHGACYQSGVMFDIGGGALAFDLTAFPAGGPQPQGWSEFWDVKRFPGPRALPNIGIPWWPLIAALQADGVPKEELFPLDLDRAFAKLDQIKPHVAVWWASGDQSQQIMRSREVVMSMMFGNRALQLRSQSLPVGVVWNGAPADISIWAVIKDAKHPNAALALIDFMMARPQAHAAYERTVFADTANNETLALLSADEQKVRPSYPDNWSKLVMVDRDWVAANRERVTERWLTWLAT